MAARFKINAGKTAPKAVPTPQGAPSWVLGSRPPDLRSPRIKPVAPGTPASRDYLKNNVQPNPAGAGFGNTGLGSLS